MLRIILAILAALVVNFLVVMGIESLGHAIYPPPAGLDPRNPDHLKDLMQVMPMAAKAMVLVAWGIGAFAASSTALLISGRVRWTAWAPLVLTYIGAVMSFMMIPHPAWMIAGGLLLPVLGALLALALFGAQKPPARA